MIDQRTDEWFAQRMGKVTASRVADVMATIKSGEAAARRNYKMELLCQRLTGQREEGFNSAAMQRGTDLEPIARSEYELRNDVMVSETGFVIHPVVEQFGASPDGLVGESGLLEIKCPNTATHIEFLRTGRPDSRYVWQMMAQMACTDRGWCDFVSYDDRLPEKLSYASVCIHRNADAEAAMLKEITAFLSELDALETEMRERMAA